MLNRAKIDIIRMEGKGKMKQTIEVVRERETI